MADGVLKAFLVTLAYEVDRATEQRFTSSVTGATKVVTGLGEAVAAVATAVTVGVDLMTQRFEKLYYSSQRTGASAGHIKAFGFAVGQMGSSAEAGQAALESFTRTLREAPSRFAQLRDLGVRVADNNGKIRDTVALLTDFGAVLSKKDYYVGLQYAAQYGIDEDTYRALRRTNELRAYAREYRDKMKAAGLDPQAAAQASMQFQNVWRSMWASVDVITSRIGVSFIKNLKGPFKTFTKLLDDKSPDIVAVFDKLSAAALELGTYLLEKVSSQEFKDWVDWVCKPETWAGFLHFLHQIHDVFVLIWGIASKFFGGMEKFLASPAYRFFTDPAGLGKDLHDQTLGQGGSFGGEGGNDGNGFTLRNGWNWLKGKIGGGGNAGGSGADASRGGGGKNLPAINTALQDQLIKEGVSPGNARAAAAALSGNVVQESGGNANAIHDGGTGLGIYGAGHERKSRMLSWLAQNGFAANDPAGQARFMAHEAMTDPTYRQTAAALRGATRENLGNVTNTVALNFERPAPGPGAGYDNRRNNAARQYATMEPSTLSKIAGAARAIVVPSTASAAESPHAQRTPYGDLSHVPPATAGGGSSTTNNKNNDVDQHNHTTVNMYGFAGHDMSQAGYKVGEHINNVQGTAVRNLVGAIE